MLLLMGFCLLLDTSQFQKMDMKDAVIMRPVKVQHFQNRYYILDFDSGKVCVFSDTQFLFSMGHRGQGPGEYQDPLSFHVNHTGVWIQENSTGEVHQYQHEGNFLKTVQLDQSALENFYASDLIVGDEQITVVYNRGLSFVKIFSTQGSLIKTIQKKQEAYPAKVSNAYRLHSKDKDHFWVFSLFDGSLKEVNHRNGELKEWSTQWTSTPTIVDNISKMAEKELQKSGTNEMDSIHLFFTLQDFPSGIGAISRVRIKDSENRQQLTWYPNGTMEAVIVNFSNIKEGVSHIQTFLDTTLVIDRQGDVFIQRGKQ